VARFQRFQGSGCYGHCNSWTEEARQTRAFSSATTADDSRGAPRSFAAQKALAQDDKPISGFVGEHFADAAKGVALGNGEGEEFEAVAQAVSVADDGAHL
jgi:hypothetical protein